MKIFDCFMYFDEDVVLDVRLNLLSKYVDKFVIIESKYNHKGDERQPLFNINKFDKFRDKIIYILKSDIPEGIEKIQTSDNEDEIYRKSIFNAWKRENLQRNQIMDGILDADNDDWIIVSDLDEIPNLEEINFNTIENKLIFFEQHMIYYKFNLKLENFVWFGSKACKFKNLKSPQWLRDIKTKKFPWWRVDTMFSEKKYRDIYFVKNGGWHFSYLKNPKDIEKKLKSYLHHIDYDKNPLGIEKIKNVINEKKAIYDLRVDQRKNKFEAKNQLIKIDINQMPSYIQNNIEKFREWIDND